MRTSATSLLAFLPLLAMVGCPYIPGSYEDYIDGGTDVDSGTGGERSRYFVGDMSWTETRGYYWADGESGDVDSATVVVGFVEGGGRSVLARWAGGAGNCRRSDGISSVYDNAVDVAGPDTMNLDNANSSLVLQEQDEPYWGIALADGESFGHRSTYELNGFSTEMGEVETFDLVRTPRRLNWTSPSVDGESLSSVSRTSARLQWDNQDDAVLARFITIDANGGAIEDVICGVAGGETAFTITPDELPSMAEATNLFILLGNVSNGSGEVVDGIANDVGAIYWQRGVVTFASR